MWLLWTFFFLNKKYSESTIFHSGLVMIEPSIYAKNFFFLHEITSFLHARSHIYLCVLAFGILVSLIIFFNHDIKNCTAYSPIEFPAPVMEIIKN